LGKSPRDYRPTKKKHRLHATIAFEYGINPYELTTSQLVALEANLQRLKAQRRIESGDYDHSDYQAVYTLFLIAFEDEELARAAQSRAVDRFIDKMCGKMK
jgi:hypothetical protein